MIYPVDVEDAPDHRSKLPTDLVTWTTLLGHWTDLVKAGEGLRRAAESHGVLRLSGHGVSIERVLNASRALFELPLDVKAATQTVQAGGGFQRGYIPMGGEAGLSNATCSGECAQGYYCEAGSVSAKAAACGTTGRSKREGAGPPRLNLGSARGRSPLAVDVRGGSGGGARQPPTVTYFPDGGHAP